MWFFSKFHLLQLLVPRVYYAKTPITLLIWRKKHELMLMTFANRQPMCALSYGALNVELWDQILVHLIWIFCCSAYLRLHMWSENGGSCFIICTHPQGMWHKREKFTKFWWGNPKERHHSEDQGVERIVSEWILGRPAGVWIGFC
jgi:hypothetical protein